MRRLLIRADGFGVSFLRGAGAAAVAIGIPVVLGAAFLGEGPHLLARLGASLLISIGFATIAGLACGVWSLVQRWAYDRWTSGPFR